MPSGAGFDRRRRDAPEVFDVRAYGADGNGTTDDTAAIQAAIAACPVGGVVWLPRVGSYYKITNAITIEKSLHVESAHAEIRQVTTGKNGFTVTASDVTIRQLAIHGAQFADQNAGLESGINISGASEAAALTGIRVERCRISNFGDYGVYLKWVKDFHIEGDQILDIFYAGVMGESIQRGRIAGNLIRNITGTSVSNAYGVAVTRAAESNLTTHPRSTDIVIEGNVIQDIPGWEGIDTHGGQRITIRGNIVKNCNIGINATLSADSGGTELYAPLDVHISDNVIDSTVINGSRSPGIQVIGANSGAIGTPTQKATGCVVVGNTVRGHGDFDLAGNTGGIVCRDTQGLVIGHNNLVECSPTGINFESDNYDFICDGNTINDVFSDTVNVNQARAIALRSGANRGLITGNMMFRGDHVIVAGEKAFTHGIRVEASAPLLGWMLGVNYCVGHSGSYVVDGSNLFEGSLRLPSYIELSEIADPVAPNANMARTYVRDNGAGKTQHVTRYPTGSIQQESIEP